MRTVYVDALSETTDPRIASAYQSALYAANSRTGNFRDSKGYQMLKQAAYAIQRSEDHVSNNKTTRFIVSE